MLDNLTVDMIKDAIQTYDIKQFIHMNCEKCHRPYTYHFECDQVDLTIGCNCIIDRSAIKIPVAWERFATLFNTGDTDHRMKIWLQFITKSVPIELSQALKDLHMQQKENLPTEAVIQQGFATLKSFMYPEGIPLHQENDLKIAYFSGAQLLASSMLSILANDIEPTAEDMTRLDNIIKELETFSHELKSRLVPVQVKAEDIIPEVDPMQMITLEQLKQAIKLYGITKFHLRNCSICESPLSYLINNDVVYYDSSCGCTTYPQNLHESSLHDLLEVFNKQSNPEIRKKMWQQFVTMGRAG